MRTDPSALLPDTRISHPPAASRAAARTVFGNRAPAAVIVVAAIDHSRTKPTGDASDSGTELAESSPSRLSQTWVSSVDTAPCTVIPELSGNVAGRASNRIMPRCRCRRPSSRASSNMAVATWP